MKLPKILAPIKTLEETIKVIEAGADEVYCGVRVPSMGRFVVKRMFDPIYEVSGYEELEKIVEYSHKRNVRVIVTVNQPFIVEEMRNKIEKHFHSCLEKSVDAFLIGDMGVLSVFKSLKTDIPFYASTYMITMNCETVKLLEDLGFSRVILDRQLTLNELSHIVKQSKVDLEVFIHGGGCSNIDGSCYLFHYMFPSMIKYLSSTTNLYGNPCTMPYDLYELESNKKVANDLPVMDAFEYCSLCRLPDLLKLGVAGFKIEGRGADLSYKVNTIKVYRELLNLLALKDLRAFEEKIESLRKTFNPFLPSIANLNDILCSQRRCYYPNLLHTPYKIPLSWQSWTKTQYNTLVLLE